MKMTDVFIEDVAKKGLEAAVSELFGHLKKSGPILKSSKEVYIKVNGIDFKKHVFTSPEVLEAVIMYLRKINI